MWKKNKKFEFEWHTPEAKRTIKKKIFNNPYSKHSGLIHKDWLEPEYEMPISQKNRKKQILS